MASARTKCAVVLVRQCQNLASQHQSNIARSTPLRKMSTQLLQIDTPVVPLAEARRFMVDCMVALGTPRPNAEALGDNLVEADYRGHYSHGMNRLDMYVRDVEGGLCDCQANPEIIKETPATAWVDGKNGLGAVVGKFCMELAIKKAKEIGVGWVVAKESNHYGIAGIYSLQAIKQGVLGMSFTNTSPLMAPTRARGHALGTNPLSLGAPASGGDSFLLDMATTAVAVGKIEMQKRKKEPIPRGWAQDLEGNITEDPAVAYDAKRLMPLGGAEIHSGYKGYGLGMLVEIFCGILGGSSYGPNIRMWGDSTRKANLGQCFIAIDQKCFAPDFENRLSNLIASLRNMEPASPDKPVLVAGDPERLHMIAVDEAGGVRYVQDQHDTCKELAERLKVRPIKPL